MIVLPEVMGSILSSPGDTDFIRATIRKFSPGISPIAFVVARHGIDDLVILVAGKTRCGSGEPPGHDGFAFDTSNDANLGIGA